MAGAGQRARGGAAVDGGTARQARAQFGSPPQAGEPQAQLDSSYPAVETAPTASAACPPPLQPAPNPVTRPRPVQFKKVLPEMWNCPYSNDSFPTYAEDFAAAPSGGAPSYSALLTAAAAAGVTLVGGSVPERDGGRLYNTCCVVGPDGRLLAKHRRAARGRARRQGAVGGRRRPGAPPLGAAPRYLTSAPGARRP